MVVCSGSSCLWRRATPFRERHMKRGRASPLAAPNPTCEKRRSDQPSLRLRLPLGFVLLLCAKQETHNTRSWAGQRERSARAAAMEAAFDVGSHDISDPSEAQAEHIPVKKLSIGTWNLLAKYDEHVLLSFYWAERKLVREVLHLGVVRKMEVDFEDIAQITHSSGADSTHALCASSLTKSRPQNKETGASPRQAMSASEKPPWKILVGARIKMHGLSTRGIDFCGSR